MRATPPTLGELSQPQLAALLPEYLLAGHLIDRAGMPHLISTFGLETMRDVAIEEWMGASPVYTKRMQRALEFEGTTVATIFKGLQLDIGAPPQFMDFRYQLDGDDRGEFWLDHCGALMDVEPMGDEFVVAMCHDIEDPTFDATAIATNPRARIRPIHRPPRAPADRSPHCHWTVVIDDEHEPLAWPAEALAIAESEAAAIELPAADVALSESDGVGWSDYTGPLLADLRFADWSSRTLIRVIEEVCLQGHLLVLSFLQAVGRRVASEAQVRSLARHQFIGAAGIAARRIRASLGLGDDLDAAAAVLELHPALLPMAYVERSVSSTDRLIIRLATDSPAQLDGAWPALLDAADLSPLDAIVREVDARFRCQAIDGSDESMVFEVVMDDEPAPLASDVALTEFSTGADFAFSDRGAPVEIGHRANAN